MSIHLISIHQQMSSCLTGAAGRSYALDLEMMIIKSPSSTSSSTITSHSPTLSESIGNYANSPFTISTRKPRTPRKRPNQTYNEAAALLSTAYPGIFSAKPCKFTKPIDILFSGGGSSDLLPHHHHHHHHHRRPNPPVSEKPRLRLAVETNRLAADENILDGIDEGLQTESMFDGEIEEGIDSIMGNNSDSSYGYTDNNSWCYGYPMGWGIDGSCQRNGVRALRHSDDGDWWRYPRVDVTDIAKIPSPEKPNLTVKHSSNHGLLLKLNHDNILAEWSDRGSPFSDEHPPGNEELYDRLAEIDLFSDNGVREASVLRYKEKRRSRLFFKKIRYQVRKVNADQRPRLKGRFVRRPGDEET